MWICNDNAATRKSQRASFKTCHGHHTVSILRNHGLNRDRKRDSYHREPSLLSRARWVVVAQVVERTDRTLMLLTNQAFTIRMFAVTVGNAASVRGGVPCSARVGVVVTNNLYALSHLTCLSALPPSLSSSVAHLVVTVHIRLYCHDKVGGEGGRGRGVTALKRREPRNLISHLRSLSLEADEVQKGSDPEDGEVLL